MYCLSKKLLWSFSLISLVTLAFLAFNLASQAKGQEKETVESQLDKALSYYWKGKFDEGIGFAKSLFKMAQTTQDTIGVYEVLSVITYAKGKKYHEQAEEYLRKMAELDPINCGVPQEYWPDRLKSMWYSYQAAMNVLAKVTYACVDTLESPGIQTIAVVNFDNTSIADHKELEPLGKGLAAFFLTDLKKITKLKIVEREKINYVIEELKREATVYFDQKTVVKIGKLLGAHTMIFGSFMKLDDRHMRVDARVVKTETGEILVAESEEGRPKDIFKLEKNLVLRIAKALEIVLNKEEKEEIEFGGSESLDAATLYAQGLEYQDKFDYENAYKYYEKAVKTDPDFKEAKDKMEILKPLIRL